ncbi:hypothetical protein Celal_3081 [Cellulophaga algicola DSM 14237]|uniref:Uncharacterized protein n=2 Tax=Cellulophaga TaxID=104264 RepID=E6X413_CELAD|nr:hypothetical protein Celal_3081 [Cellulophaga algicola DSM 14237]
MKNNFLILFLLFMACKGENKNLIATLTIQDNDSLVQVKQESIPLEFISKLPDFELPLGNIDVVKTIFPDKFGLPLETDEDGAYLNLKSDVFTKKIQSNTNTWKKISNTDGLNYTLTIEDSLKYSMYSNFGKQVVRENYEFIGKIRDKDFIMLLGKHTSDNALKSYNFITIVMVSVDGVIIDDLILYKQEFDYVSSYSTFSFMDKQRIISSKSFFAIEGEYFSEKTENYQISSEGKFIRYYGENGDYKNELEQAKSSTGHIFSNKDNIKEVSIGKDSVIGNGIICSELHISFYENGLVKEKGCQGIYKGMGTSVGTWYKYNSSGVLVEKVYYHLGTMKDAYKEVVEYYLNGNKKSIERFTNDVLFEIDLDSIGEWEYYDLNGKLMKTKSF